MQIALTKKLADAMNLKALPDSRDENPLFSWTANWTNVWENRKKEELLVLVNNATRIIVGIYQVKRKDLVKAPEIMEKAIKDTLLAMDYDPKMVEEYLRLGGPLVFTQNRNRQTASWVSQAGLECAFQIDREYNGIPKMFDDTIGAPLNHRIVNIMHKVTDAYFPDEAMGEELSKLTGAD